jgi:hypothetical protein
VLAHDQLVQSPRQEPMESTRSRPAFLAAAKQMHSAYTVRTLQDLRSDPNCRLRCRAPYAIARVLRRILRKSCSHHSLCTLVQANNLLYFSG